MSVGGVTGKVVLITGAGGGIGRATAEAFAQAGAHLFLTDDAPGPERVAGIEFPSARADVTDASSVDKLFDVVDRTYGRIDAVVHTAGILCTGSVVELADSDWDRVLAVNATGTMLICRAAARSMPGPGSITVVSSNAGATPRAGMAAYAASKAAATTLVRSLGLELASRGIRCNVISPGSTETPMLQGMRPGSDGPAETIAGNPDLFKLGIPLGRIADPADIAGTAVFLVSDAARHVTLHDLRVDGGATLDQ